MPLTLPGRRETGKSHCIKQLGGSFTCINTCLVEKYFTVPGNNKIPTIRYDIVTENNIVPDDGYVVVPGNNRAPDRGLFMSFREYLSPLGVVIGSCSRL